MDEIISSALEEICAKGRDGLAISSLCSNLNLSFEIKRALWTNLLKIPTIQFQVRNLVYDSDDPSIRCFDDAEKLDLVIVAKDRLRDNFLGVYGFSLGVDEKEYRQQRLALERIATARTNGITQSQLSKEFGMEGNKTFYVVKKLEKSGLIVRQEAVERTRATGNQGQSTRLIHLRRYAKNLGSQQKFEITKEEETMGNADSQIKKIKEDVLVKDYVPSMKAICDKLEEANGKVLVISDIKHDLGYGGSRPKHRNWKNICGRLINAGVVEETYVKVNGKDELCLHLLKKFSPIDFEQKTIKYVEGNELKFGRCQRANQLVELPIDHQIYDAIDAAGFEGMLIKEVSQRFGLDQKTSLKNCSTMSNKFGMHMQRELHNKTCEYRIRTARNCESSNEIPSGSKDLSSKSSSLFVVNPGFSEGPAQLHLWNSEIDTLGKANNWEAERELSCFSPKGSEASGIITNNCESQELIHGAEKQFTNTGLHSVNTARMALKPCPALTVDSFRREQRILEWLQVEKIVLKAELYRWLVNLEKDKGTTMDRKTVDRILHKLENQGQCRCILLAINELMNTDGNRKVKVVLHPSIQSLSSEILGRIRDRLISFEKQTHGQASFRKKNINSVLVLDHVQRTITRNGSHAFALRMAAMRANGFTSGKMVRAKLLHSFLWEYACGSSSKDGVSSYGKQDHDIQNPHVTCNMFDVEAAIKSIPLELFLQVVGSTVKVDNMMEMFKNGVRLGDLSIQEYNDLNNTSAIRRLSSILSILQRLKLVTSGSSDDEATVPNACPVYAMELKAYIEEPPLTETYSNSGSLDLFPNTDAVREIIRHDFFLSDRDAIDEYWRVLEYIYAVADPKSSSCAFPGSTVHEIFGHGSWGAGRGMASGEHAKVLKHIGKQNFNRNLPYKECKKIAKTLNLRLEQVLHVYYTKLRRCRKFQDNLNAVEAEQKLVQSSSFSRKRKISAEAKVLKHRRIADKNGTLCQHILPRSAGNDDDLGPVILCSSEGGDYKNIIEGMEWNQNRGVGQEEQCDNLNGEKINLALEEVLQRRQVDILEAPQKPADGCNSQFPPHTGSSAAKFSRWLHERKKDFMRGGIDLTADLRCGEIFHLFALVSSGELFISPCLPVEGVGEAEHTRSLKHVSHFNDSCDIRREKGFPGIKLSVHRLPKQTTVALESSFKNGEKSGNGHFVDGNHLRGILASLTVGSNPLYNLNLGKPVPKDGDSCVTPWEVMAEYATKLISLPSNQEYAGTLSPEVFKAVYTALQKAGDQGLAIREVSRVMDTSGEKMTELVIDVLQNFGRAEKVRVNGSLYAIARSTEKPSSIHMDDNDLQQCNILNHHDDGGSGGPSLDETDQ